MREDPNAVIPLGRADEIEFLDEVRVKTGPLVSIMDPYLEAWKPGAR